jgi:hypothetical protein
MSFFKKDDVMKAGGTLFPILYLIIWSRGRDPLKLKPPNNIIGGY